MAFPPHGRHAVYNAVTVISTRSRTLLVLLLCMAPIPACSVRRGPTAPLATEGFRLEEAWSTAVADAGPIQIASAPGGFVAATSSGDVLFADGATGKVAWKKSVGAALSGPLVVIGGEVGAAGPERSWAAAVTESGDVAIVPLDPAGVVARWSLGWPGAILTATSGGVMALDSGGAAAFHVPGEAAARWELRLSPLAPVPAAPCGAFVLAGQADGRLVAIEPGSGRILWRKRLGSPLAAAPACEDRFAFAATGDNFLYALRIHRRSAGKRWRIRSGADPAAPPLPLGGTVVLLSKDTYLYAFNRRNGHLKFRIRLDRRPGPAARMEDVLLVAGSHASLLGAYRLPTGAAAGAFSLPVGGHFVSPPVVSGDHLAIAVARYGEEASTLVGLAKREGAADVSGTSP